DGGHAGTGNFVVFRYLSGDDFSLRMRDDDTLGHGWFRPGIAGLQVVGGSGKDDVVLTGDLDQDFVLGDNGYARLQDSVPYMLSSTDIRNVEAGIESDRIQTGGESDIIIGGNDGDNLIGDEGHDRIIGDNATVFIYDGDIGCLPEILADPNGNTGTVRDVNLIPGLELHYYDTADGTTRITGNDRLEGGQGEDVLYGMYGDDTYAFVGGGLGHDQLVEAGDDEELFN
ncbi:MAG: hypothetical protein GY888_02175, partial [Planctomycetaceae bacterium]|nr:hypothetical protein [Planctomycetaceae bacterium]